MLDSHLIAKTRPLAEKNNTVYWGNYRVTVLSDRLFRMERSENRKFRDGATQTVWFRDMPAQNFEVCKNRLRCVIQTSACKLIIYGERERCRVEINGKRLKISNSGNLGGTYRTLDLCDGDTKYLDYINKKSGERIILGPGVCSKTGVAVFDDAPSLTLADSGEITAERGDGTDEYIFAFGTAYKDAIRALYMITGTPPMVPRFAFGNWWSRYFVYTEKSYLALMNTFAEQKIPFTVATVDMDWHYSETLDEEFRITERGKNTPFYGGGDGWTGYTWNKRLFPDYKRFLRELHKAGLKVTLNLHPAEGVRWFEDCYADMAMATGKDPATEEVIQFDITDSRFINGYFSVIHKPYERDGVDFWWMDWQQGTSSAVDGLDPLWALNHYHFLDHAKNHTDPILLSRYAGIGSHRYSIGFSGDTFITWKTLDFLPYFTLTASNVGFTYWSHDIGGHMLGITDGELYVRSIQFGVFSPINRLHNTNQKTVTKEPWAYLKGVGAIAEKWLRLRHKMIPLLYSAAYRTHTAGEPLIEPLYYYYPNYKEAYKFKNQYFFARNFMISPITRMAEKDGFARVKTWIPGGRWTDVFTGDIYDIAPGGEVRTLCRSLESIPVLAAAGSCIVLSGDEGNDISNPDELKVFCYSGNGSFTLYENEVEGEIKKERFSDFVLEQAENDNKVLLKLRVSIRGEKMVAPENRKISVKFADIEEGEIKFYKDGKESPINIPAFNCAAAEFLSDGGSEYLLEVRYEKQTKLNRLKNRAEKILAGAEGDNKIKSEVYDNIIRAENVGEYIKAVSSAALSEGIKLRLTETL